MLTELPRIYGSVDAVRLSNSKDKVDALLEMGVEPSDIDDSIQYFGDLDVSPDKHLAWIFDQVGQKNVSRTRFTDGLAPVLYTALNVDTACAEIAHWLSPLPGIFIYYRSLRVEFEGDYKDLLSLQELPNYLVGEESDGAYAQCTELAAAARLDDLDAFKTPSARLPQGVCFPILTRTSIRSLIPATYVRFRYDEQAQGWTSKLL